MRDGDVIGSYMKVQVFQPTDQAKEWSARIVTDIHRRMRVRVESGVRRRPREPGVRVPR